MSDKPNWKTYNIALEQVENYMQKEFNRFMFVNRSVSFLPKSIMGASKMYERLAHDRQNTLYRLLDEIEKLRTEGIITPQAEERLKKAF